MRVHAQRAGALVGGLMFPAWSMADWTLNMTPGVTGSHVLVHFCAPEIPGRETGQLP